ncbi:MAG: PQQ-dependent sugar dehydrogenase [Pseudolysinimonas sp.]
MARHLRPASVAALAAVALSLGALAGCSTPGPSETIIESGPPTPSPSATPNGVVPAGTPADVVTGLASPWSILRVSDTLTLVSERDSGVIERVTASGKLEKIGTVPGVVRDGEAGLLGLAFLEASAGTRTSWLYAYETTASDNRIVRMSLNDQFTLGPPQVILKGLISANHHDGGRIAFGPDGMLYATVGDAGDTSNSQNLKSLNGKILRMTPTGDVPKNNPFPGSLIWSYGHRNPQGLAWDSTGQLYAAEFGQDTWDEFNKITAGKNYGWPIAEGIAHDPRFVDPLVQWSTDDASPSGLVYIDGTFFLAGLGGKRLWVINVDAAGAANATALYVGQYGRLRDVAVGPSVGSLPSLWILTDNTDGRGSPHAGDDRILQVALTAAQ